MSFTWGAMVGLPSDAVLIDEIETLETELTA
jgi:hypothetical protein